MFTNRHFTNRELSWLRFNFRVLQEATRKSNPLLERLRFLAIVASNLDEFFEVRVSALEQQLEAQKAPEDKAGYTPAKLLTRIYKNIDYLIQKLYLIWNTDIVPNLSKEKINILKHSQLTQEQKGYVDKMYWEEFHPILTPIKVDPAHPFPWIINKALCIAILFDTKNSEQTQMGVVTVPRLLPRIIKIPSMKGLEPCLILISEIIQENLDSLFKGYRIRAKVPFRVTRNSNLYLNEEETSDLLGAIEAELHNRRKGDAVRLEIRQDAPQDIVKQLCEIFSLADRQVHLVDGPVNFNRVMSIYEMIEQARLKYKPFTPREPRWFSEGENIFKKIAEGDFVLHHPYESFKPVIHFLEKAALDENVLAIKMTLYRIATDSPLMHALIEAAKNGKEVTVVVELKARFDEASNVAWAKYLLEHGVHVVYGLLGLKTHSKLILIVRSENKKLIKYAHIGTGNYNENTARYYTDLSLFTCKKDITEDVVEIFNFLTSQSKQPHFKRLIVAPYFMTKKFLSMIENERKAAKEGHPARIIFKVNALQEPQIIEALYKASQDGVKIFGIVRGICCLRPEKKGYSENIEIKSIIGRFLEHSRVFYFENAKPYSLFIGSSDWMPRNLHRRIEVVAPIADPKIARHIIEDVLEIQLRDNFNGRILGKKWEPTSLRKTKYVHSQQIFMDRLSK